MGVPPGPPHLASVDLAASGGHAAGGSSSSQACGLEGLGAFAQLEALEGWLEEALARGSAASVEEAGRDLRPSEDVDPFGFGFDFTSVRGEPCLWCDASLLLVAWVA